MAMIYFNLNHLNFYILYKTSHICAWLYFKNELEIDSVGDVCVVRSQIYQTNDTSADNNLNSFITSARCRVNNISWFWTTTYMLGCILLTSGTLESGSESDTSFS